MRTLKGRRDLVVGIDADYPVIADDLHAAATIEMGDTLHVCFGRGHLRSSILESYCLLHVEWPVQGSSLYTPPGSELGTW